MPAESRKQQRFFGMVDAAQKGELEHPSSAVKKAAASMKHGDVEDFASTSHAGLPEKKTIEEILEAIAGYNKLGETLKRATTMMEVGTQLAQIAEYAEQAVVNEADNWFDKHTVGRNMKEIKSYSKDFSKLAEESDQINQRMTALYDDMGRILERYFEIPDGYDPMVHMTQGKDGNEEPEVEPDKPIELTEAPGQPGMATPPDPKIYRATPLPPVTSEPSKIDALTLKAIKAVHGRLKKKNPDAADKFAKLPPKQMQKLVWKLIQ